MRKCPVKFDTKRMFEHVIYDRKRYGRNTVGHKMAQRKAVAKYLEDRKAR